MGFGEFLSHLLNDEPGDPKAQSDAPPSAAPGRGPGRQPDPRATRISELYQAGLEARRGGNDAAARGHFERAVLASRGAGEGPEVAVSLGSCFLELGELLTGPDDRYESALRFQQGGRLLAKAARGVTALDADLAAKLERMADQAAESAQRRLGAARENAAKQGDLLRQERNLINQQWESWAARLGRS